MGVIGPFWAKWELGQVLQTASFFCGNPRDLSATSQQPISTKVGHRTYFGVSSRNQNLSVKQAPHSGQATGHGIHYREILFTPRCSPRAREFLKSVNFSVRCTAAELWGVKVTKFSDFGLFKTYLPVTSLQPRGYIAEWLRFFRVVVEGPKGCLPVALFSCDLSWGHPNLPKFSSMANGYTHVECYYTARQIWTKNAQF